jgi:hypothetical protein
MAKKKALRTEEPKLTTDDISALKQLIGLIPVLTQAVQGTVKKEEVPHIHSNPEADILPRRRSGVKKKKKDKLRRSSGQPTRVQSLPIGPRPNLFEQSPDFKSPNVDREIDATLWKGRTVTPRDQRSTTVDIDCDECGDEFTVSPNELIRTTDDNGRPEVGYLCNDCINSKRR